MNIDATAYRSPNHSARTRPISAFVLHTGEGTRASDLATLCNGASRNPVSAHYYVDRAGRIYQLVDDSRAAWHAGASHYLGLPNWNDFSLGCETEHKRGQDWPAVQLEAIRWLIQTKAAAHGIPIDLIAAHRWIAPTRKYDPTDLTNEYLYALFKACGQGWHLGWRPYRVTVNGSRIRKEPVAAGAIVKTVNAGFVYWAATVRGAAVGKNTTWLALRSGGYMHSSLASVARDLEAT